MTAQDTARAPAPRARERPAPEPGQSAVPAGAFLKRAEVRDVLAWMRLLADPQDAVAVVRALARPPVELRQTEIARVLQVARRRSALGAAGRQSLVAGLAAATESPQVPLEARERIRRFVALHAAAAAELDALAPDEFLASLIERVGAGGRSLLAGEGASAGRSGLTRLQALADEFARANPAADARALARHLATVTPAEAAGPSEQADPTERPPPEEPLQAALASLREQVLDSVARIGSRLGELRLDTDLDVAHGVVRYLELLKVSALLQRPPGQSLEEALADLDARLAAAATPLQREILETSTLDRSLGARDVYEEEAISLGGHGDGGSPSATASRAQRSLVPFLPRRGNGLALSASDVHTYRSCPLRYKYARVLRIPLEQTLSQRFGIVVHQVLERYHRERLQTLAQMLSLLDACWRRSGLPMGGGRAEQAPAEAGLLEKARAALTRYHARLGEQRARPVWFERQFDFRLGPHHVRGRVDRVDRLEGVACGAGPPSIRAGAGARYELIDYKTSRPKTAEQLDRDVQLSLYALAAREDWGLECSQQAYYYVLDDLKVQVAGAERDLEAVERAVLEVGEGIMAQAFEPTPSAAVCAMCDYRIVCPVAEG
ncbi:MAG TPA: PD-(D/E)XK nuclease family protein [Solirubrobacteraceae bacterium]|nr:PD-(D/E)XK nuclease family protein [Solirubrobacteraceae bacterium]